MWILIIAGYFAITGYPTEAACQEAATHQQWLIKDAVFCIPASKDAVVYQEKKPY